MLARFADAALKAKTDREGGRRAYDALADDASLDPLLRESARLRAALARLDAGETDAAKAALETLGDAGRRLSQHRAADARRASRSARKDYAGAGKWLDLVVADPAAPQTERRERRNSCSASSPRTRRRQVSGRARMP